MDGLTNPKYNYDNNGNMTCVYTGTDCASSGGRRIDITSFNMVAGVTQGVTSLYFVYDDQHQRVAQISTITGASPPTSVTTYLNDPASGAMSIHTVTGTGTLSQWNGFNWAAAIWYGNLPNNSGTWSDYITLDGQIVAQRDSSYSSASAWTYNPDYPSAGPGPNWNTLKWGGGTTSMVWTLYVPPPPGPNPHWNSAPWDGLGTVPTVTISYFTLDHLGSVAVVANSSGSVTQRLSYDPWGKQRNPNGTDAACGTITSPTTRGFTNQEEMPTQCLVNLNARLYDPSIGKFMAPDSIVANPFNGQSFNRYAYVNNNPLSFTDVGGNAPGDPGFDINDRDTWDPNYSCIGCGIDLENTTSQIEAFANQGITGVRFLLAAVFNDPSSSPGSAGAAGFQVMGNNAPLAMGADNNANPDVETVTVTAPRLNIYGYADQAQDILERTFGAAQNMPSLSSGLQNVAFNGEIYDPNNPKYHHYIHDDILCYQSESCTPGTAFQGLLRYAAPGQTVAAYTGNKVDVIIGGISAGTVTQVVDQANLTVYNITDPGHIFDPGYVARSIVVEKGFVMVQTIGEGTGNYPLFNENIARPTWSLEDLEVKQYVLTHGRGGT